MNGRNIHHESAADGYAQGPSGNLAAKPAVILRWRPTQILNWSLEHSRRTGLLYLESNQRHFVLADCIAKWFRSMMADHCPRCGNARPSNEHWPVR